MNIKLFIVVFVVSSLFLLYIGKSTIKNANKNEDFFLAKRSIGFFPLIMTFLATQVGGGMILGAAQEAFYKGWEVVLYPLGISFGLIVLGISGFGTKLRKYNISTIPELIEKTYGSIILRKLTSILSIFTMLFILVAQAIAVKQFFSALGFNNIYLFCIFWNIMIIYTSMGGFKAVVKTDVYQMIFIMIIFIITIVSTFFNPIVKEIFMDNDFWKWNICGSSSKWIDLIIIPFLFMFIEQDMGQRCFAAKTSKTLFWSTILSGVILFFVSLIPVYFGNIARMLFPSINENAGVLIIVVESLSNPIISTFFACALLMVVMSTADSILCAISSLIAYDFKRNKSSHNKIINDNQVIIPICIINPTK